MLIFGTRANPLSYFLTRSLNIRLHASNVYCVDTPATREQNRLLPIRDVYGCTQLPDLQDQGLLDNIVGENEITDVIDMTNTSCKTLQEEVAPVTNL